MQETSQNLKYLKKGFILETLFAIIHLIRRRFMLGKNKNFSEEIMELLEASIIERKGNICDT